MITADQISATAAERYRGLFPTEFELSSVNGYEKYLGRTDKLTPVLQEAIGKAREFIARGRPIVYVAGALTGVDEETKLRYTQVAEILERMGFLPYVPHLHGTDPKKNPNVSPTEVADIDRLWAAVVPAFQVNFLFPIAHGNAHEIAWDELRKIPAIALFPSGLNLSRLTRGLINIDTVIGYTKLEDGFRIFEGILRETNIWRSQNPGQDILGFFAKRKGLDWTGPLFDSLNPFLVLEGAKKSALFAAYIADSLHPLHGEFGYVTGVHAFINTHYFTVIFSDGGERWFPFVGRGGKLVTTPLVLISVNRIKELYDSRSPAHLTPVIQ